MQGRLLKEIRDRSFRYPFMNRGAMVPKKILLQTIIPMIKIANNGTHKVKRYWSGRIPVKMKISPVRKLVILLTIRYPFVVFRTFNTAIKPFV